MISEDFSTSRPFAWEDLRPLAQYTSEGDKVLDLGCGNGRLLQIFQDKNIDYFGVDNSEKLIEIAKKKNPNVKFQTADALNLPLPDNYFDEIYSIALLHHIPSAELRLRLLKEAKRVLKPKGLLILTVWNLWQRKTAWNLFIKNIFLKLTGKSKLDFKDIFYPWKGQNREVVIQRYFHLFTKGELKNLVQKAGFKVKEIRTLKRERSRESNILLISEK